MKTAELLPNFLIAGAPKAGTTSLYHYLGQHPEICMSLIKEPHYFASEIRPERFSPALRPQAEQDAQALRKYLKGPMTEKRFGGTVTEWLDYLKLFQRAGARKAIGEASVCYLWSESAAGNIRARIPNARIILVLRNPVDVMFSLYLHTLRSGAIQCSFHEAIEMGLAQRSGELNLFHPFLDLGLYYPQVTRMLAAFPESQVRIYWYEDYSAHPSRMLADLFQFVGVDPAFRPDMSKRYLESRTPKVRKTAEDHAYLTEFYREDIEQLEHLLKRDLSSWLA